MEGAPLSRKTWLSVLAVWLIVATQVEGFTFSHSIATECQDMALQWEGGTAPFYVTVVPAYGENGARIQNVSIPSSASSNSTRAFSFRLDQPAGLDFSLILSDATGWGAGGVTPLLQVAPSSDSSCHQSPPPFGFYFYWNPSLSSTQPQCQNVQISWDAGRTYPLQLLGFVPGGSAFTIPVPQVPSDRSITWPVRVREGAAYQLLMADAGNPSTGGSTNLTRVTAGPAGCLQPNSPGPGGSMMTLLPTGTGTGGVTSLAPTASTTRDGTGNGSGGGSNGSNGSSGGTDQGSNVGAIVGGVLGGVIALVLLVILLLCCRRKRRQARAAGEEEQEPGSGQGKGRPKSSFSAVRTSGDFFAAAKEGRPASRSGFQQRDYEYKEASNHAGGTAGTGAAAAASSAAAAIVATPTALIRQATKTLKRSSTARTTSYSSASAFDILSGPPSGEQLDLGRTSSRTNNHGGGSFLGDRIAHTPTSLDGVEIDPFVSPFPRPPPRAAAPTTPQAQAAPREPDSTGQSRSTPLKGETGRNDMNGARGHNRQQSASSIKFALPPLLPSATIDATTDASGPTHYRSPGELPSYPRPPTPEALALTSGPSRKISGQYTETPPASPTVRMGERPPGSVGNYAWASPTSAAASPRSPSTGLPSRGSMRWSVDDDLGLSSAEGPHPHPDGALVGTQQSPRRPLSTSREIPDDAGGYVSMRRSGTGGIRSPRMSGQHVRSSLDRPDAGGGGGGGRRTTYIQHRDGGPGRPGGTIVDLPPSYTQLRAVNPDPDSASE